MKILEELLSELKENLQNYEIFEEIDLKISKTIDFDYQINNLVKYQNNEKINSICENFSSILSQSKNIEKFEITDSLFVNLKLNLSKVSNFINNIEEINIEKNPRRIIIDYGGPNIGKPLHVGHLRSLNIGRSLKKLNEIVGNKVTTDIHLGDWGMPVAQIISFCDVNEIDIKSLSADQLIDIYPKSADLYRNSEEFKKQAQIVNKQLNQSEKEVIKKWELLRKISIEDLKNTLKILNHDFDLWHGESNVNHLIEPMIQSLKKEGKVDYDDGALVSNEDVDPKILIAKSDGSYLYLTTDLATILDRLDNNDFDTTLYVVDTRQKLHFEQLFKTADYFNFEKRDFKHVDFGTINDEEGKPFKTREGGTKQLIALYKETFEYIKNINKDLDEEIIHDLSNTVLTYSDLLTNRKTDYKFDLNKFTNISGKTGIYVQYAQVRAKRLLEKIENNEKYRNILITNEEERKLIIGLLNLEFFIKQSAKYNEPHHLANYLYDISNLFNNFYQTEKVHSINDKEIKYSKLLITEYFLKHSILVMSCLGIKPVDKM